MFLSQLTLPDGTRAVAARHDGAAHLVPGASTTLDLAHAAIAAGHGLLAEISTRGQGEPVDLAAALAEGRMLLPVDHPDPAHLHLTGTGLTHLGSAATRNSMHQKTDPEDLTDSMKMFRMGLEGGKPGPEKIGVQPEWFWKGNGHAAIAPGTDLTSPGFALDSGEEPEIAGLYLIGPDGTPFRLGFALANEFSDHVTERGNYLWLAHSKLRPASYGPEMLIGDLPQHIEGTSRVIRDGAVIWEKPFLSGEANMSHSLANLEHHHFKYDLFRHPGDVHVHFFGTATLSFADGISVQPGDEFQISSDAFGLPLQNRLSQFPHDTTPVAVSAL
ncbi:AraD1 family protein [Paracoccus fistulariae]|uniref:GguC protein n=1 Tax=Paracoccus fistulariae TaxID=658446 RepID=A0ABY7SNW2_9RHOB|nr:AraD1 family protein [Paracoccus fistulariae]MDB6182454.1 GguC family protein [Paracoccus fistulariae]WCR08575.1 GguC protein [Paracoccus fistulariae]